MSERERDGGRKRDGGRRGGGGEQTKETNEEKNVENGKRRGRSIAVGCVCVDDKLNTTTMQVRHSDRISPAHSTLPRVLCGRSNDQLHVVLYCATSLRRLRLLVAR